MFQLLVSRFLHPELYTLGFPHGGIGIRRRAERFEPFWREHLSRTKAQIVEWTKPSQQITVLGAGSLLDLPLTQLLNDSTRLHLIDGDPTLPPLWSRQKHPQLTTEICELTGDLIPWLEELRKLPRGTGASAWAEALKRVRGRPPREISPLPERDTLVSLNLLSQIPLTWQMLVERELKRIFGSQWIEEHEESWLFAAREGGAELVARHLSMLRGAKRIVIITDLEYLFYRGVSESPVIDLPIDWQLGENGEGEWTPNERSEQFSFELMPALCGVDVTDRKRLERLFPQHRISYGPRWLWHLLPWGHPDPARSRYRSGERRHSGEVHLIGSILLEQTDIR